MNEFPDLTFSDRFIFPVIPAPIEDELIGEPICPRCSREFTRVESCIRCIWYQYPQKLGKRDEDDIIYMRKKEKATLVEIAEKYNVSTEEVKHFLHYRNIK